MFCEFLARHMPSLILTFSLSFHSGVEVPGHDGRAGMAAITLRDDVDQSTENVKELMKRLGTFATAKLPGYAVPKFVRVMSQMEVTGTFKERRKKKRKEGKWEEVFDTLIFLPTAPQGRLRQARLQPQQRPGTVILVQLGHKALRNPRASRIPRRNCRTS